MALFEHLEKLQHFKLVALEGSFSAAAKLSRQSQPALMYSVTKLEADLGAQLFLRSRAGTRLTPAGQKLLELANHLFQLSKDFEKELAHNDSFDVQMTLATHTPYLPSVIAPHLKKISAAMGASSIVLRSSLSSVQLISWVENGSADLSIVAESAIPKTLRQIHLFDDWYEFYCSEGFFKTHLRRETLGLKHASLPFVFIAKSIAGVHKTLSRALWEVGFKNPSAVEVDSYEAVAAMAGMNSGIACLPRLTNVHRYFNLRQLKAEERLSKLGKFSVTAVFKNPGLKKNVGKLKGILGGVL